MHAPAPRLSLGEIRRTDAPCPPSLNIAGGYSPRSSPFSRGVPRKLSRRRAPASGLPIVSVDGAPAACAFSMCCAVSGKRPLLTVTSPAVLLPGGPLGACTFPAVFCALGNPSATAAVLPFNTLATSSANSTLAFTAVLPIAFVALFAIPLAMSPPGANPITAAPTSYHAPWRPSTTCETAAPKSRISAAY